MPDIASMLAKVAYDMVSTVSQRDDFPPMSGYLLQGDVWKLNTAGERVRTMTVSSYAVVMPNWYFWFLNEGLELWTHHPLAQEITKIVQQDRDLTNLLTNSSPSIPGVGGTPPQNPTEPFREWVYSRLVVPIFSRALFPPRSLETIDMQRTADGVVLVFHEWQNHGGRLPGYAVGPLIGLTLPAELTIHLDSQTVVRPVHRADIEAWLNPIPSHPLASHLMPLMPVNDLLSIRHIIEYRPQNDEYPDIDEYGRGITRVLMAFRCTFGPAITTPWSSVLSDVPVPMVAGGGTPHRRIQTPISVMMGARPEWRAEWEDDLRRIYTSLGDPKRAQKLRIALSWYDKAIDDADPQNCIISAWIGLESFYGGNSQTEISYKLCLRGAFYLVRRGECHNIEDTFSKLRHLYDWRSALVHGAGRPRKNPLTKFEAAQQSVEMLRKTLKAALTDDNEVVSGDKMDKPIREVLTKAIDQDHVP